MNWLEIRQKGRRSVSISLDNTPYLKNLTEVAPMAMSQYFEQMRADGEAVPVGSGA
ncbi:hypothetical protein [Mesorhizobium muleiense]|jgi:hypothetical protein|uniref:hypothetical protein n=1 Tax=Mesorhizobium muleiense TaxID=1004279 RepID=UPI001F179EB6|nr:hypothetical protein [Mesorhizobium muleiense]MCF6113424.1 hypothetical protein [Mesorhizobium muleiense]